MDEENNLTLSQIAEKYNVCVDTICKWTKRGIISYTKLPSGIRRYHYKPEIHDAAPQPSEEPERVGVIYARVNTSKQLNDLQHQIKLLQKSYPDYELCSDVGSGLNYKRKGLRALVKRILKGDISEVVVAYRDRLSRFSFELFQWLFGMHDTRIVVLAELSSSPQRELLDDLMSILTTFSARETGLRKYKNAIKNDPDISFHETKIYSSAVDGDSETNLQPHDKDKRGEEIA